MSDASELYGLPLDRFVPERAALAKALRAAGKREDAARAAALRKPSVAAWAVNQLVRTQRRAIADLFDAGDELQRAQSALLRGRGDGHTLREAAERERALADELTRTARGLLTSSGHELSAAMLERVRETLHAAAVDPEARAQVAEGCLVREVHHVGIGPTDASPAGQARAGRRKRTEHLTAARKAAQDAGRAADRAARELTAVQQRRDRAADALEQAEAALAAARRRAAEAARAHEQAKRALTDASR